MPKSRFLFIGFCVAIMMFSNFACAVPTSNFTPDDKLLSTNYELWKNKHITNYSFDIRISVFVPGSGNLIHIEVRDGNSQVCNMETHTDASLPDWIINEYDTIGKLFERIKTAYDEEADIITVSYDTEFGFPNHAEVNPELAIFDEEWGFTMTNFTPLENATKD